MCDKLKKDWNLTLIRRKRLWKKCWRALRKIWRNPSLTLDSCDLNKKMKNEREPGLCVIRLTEEESITTLCFSLHIDHTKCILYGIYDVYWITAVPTFCSFHFFQGSITFNRKYRYGERKLGKTTWFVEVNSIHFCTILGLVMYLVQWCWIADCFFFFFDRDVNKKLRDDKDEAETRRVHIDFVFFLWTFL